MPLPHQGWLDFEQPIAELFNRLEEVTALGAESEIKRIQKQIEELKTKLYTNLTPWQKVLLARHPRRPYTLDYIERIATDFVELHGDRAFADDPAIVAGLGKIDRIPFAIIGHQKGRDTKEKLARNFGMPHPEGYRKALRVMELAARHNVPILCLIDTPGAYPGIGAEERGQAEAIARNLREMVLLAVPIIVVVIGEGGSGGALAIGVGDRIMMQENAVYSVISPEGCAAILWRDGSRAEEAAEVLKITATDLLALDIIDEIIPEPLGGAHHDWDDAARLLKSAVIANYYIINTLPSNELVQHRIDKFRAIGLFLESPDFEN